MTGVIICGRSTARGVEELNSSEMELVNGGKFMEDVGYYAGYLARKVAGAIGDIAPYLEAQ